jgi:hypothetical protein
MLVDEFEFKLRDFLATRLHACAAASSLAS